MSNPVPSPPPASEGGYPPPAEQGFAVAPDRPQVGPPPQDRVDAPVSRRRRAAGKIVLRIGLSLVALVVALVVKDTLFGDKARDAAAGDCIASSKEFSGTQATDAEATVVDCGSGDAACTVVGRVDGETDTDSTSCDTFFQKDEEFYVYSSTAGRGYLLCLRPKA